MENIKTKDEFDAAKFVIELGVKHGWKRINGRWFMNEDAFNYAKKKRPTWYGDTEFNTAPQLDNGIITED